MSRVVHQYICSVLLTEQNWYGCREQATVHYLQTLCCVLLCHDNAGKLGPSVLPLKGILCAECAATIPERSTQPLSRRAVEISLSLSCPPSVYLPQISWAVKCFACDLMIDVLVGWSCDLLQKTFNNFWKVTSFKSSYVMLCCDNVQHRSPWRSRPGPSAACSPFSTYLKKKKKREEEEKGAEQLILIPRVGNRQFPALPRCSP